MADPQLIRCAQCGAVNRVPVERLQAGAKAVCGSCKTPLNTAGSTSNGPITITDATFASEVEQAKIPVLVDMWAPWCGPCRALAPVIDQLAADFAGQVRVAKLNVDENPATAGRFNVRSIPALVVFQGGREVDRMVGAQPKTEIAKRLRQLIA